MDFKTTAELKVSDSLVGQVIGQGKGVEIIKKAAKQRRNVFLVGEPGTGKSMLGMALAELLSTEKLKDILVVENHVNRNNPTVKVVHAGRGRRIIAEEKLRLKSASTNFQLVSFVIPAIMFFGVWFMYSTGMIPEIITAALLILSGLVFAAAILAINVKPRVIGPVSKLLVDNSKSKRAPYHEGTGAKAGALLGDVRHDPFQSGGLGTPPHLRVEAGMIHKAHMGVLFIDEIATLSPKSQQELLTAMQEKRYSITGQSELSSGAMVRTEPVPCDFILVAAGNMMDLKAMHPALRSRIRGYGYEIYLNETMPDTPENRSKLAQFVAQEVKKDGKIPHFMRAAILEIINDAKRRAGRKGRLTLKLRDLGGLVRAAGDIAITQGDKLVDAKHIILARKLARTLEQQIADQYVELKKEYEVFKNKGFMVGQVNGLAVLGDGGMVLPIVAEVAPASSRQEGKIIATGKLGKIALEAVQNVSALVKKHSGKDLSRYDIHIQFLQTYEGVEGDSASVSVATAVISALEGIPVNQSVAMTGSLSVRGLVLPIGGVTQKVEAAYEAGVKKILVPDSNKEDLVISDIIRKKIEIIPVKNIFDVLKNCLKETQAKKKLINSFKRAT